MTSSRQSSAHGPRPSVNPSLDSNAIIDVLHPKTNSTQQFLGLCRGDTLTDKGKQIQTIKILALTLLPIIVLCAFTLYGLFDGMIGKSKMEQTQMSVRISVEIGKVLDRIQRERDMSVLYRSILGPQTKTFLRNEYLLTDQALNQLSSWPLKTEASSVFHSKAKFHYFLNQHRQLLNPKNFNIYVEIAFYNSLIEPFVEWLYDALTESKMASMWKMLVSYQKIVTGMEKIGIERALGVVFYVNGGFPTKTIYENYNSNVNIFKSNYRSAVLYSKQIDAIFQKGVSKSGVNLTEVIEKFRFEIQHEDVVEPSMVKGQWWFDNMTLYLDTLLIIQENLAIVINDEVEVVIRGENRNLRISGILLGVVLLMSPLVIFSVLLITNDTQKFAIILVAKTKELRKEINKTERLLYQMVPMPVADILRAEGNVDAEYFKSVTIMFSEIVGFIEVATICHPLEIVDMLNTLYAAFDEKISSYDVYNVHTINDSYMIVSGLPVRIGNKHSEVIGNLTLDLINMPNTGGLFSINDHRVEFRIGVNTGPCMAGIVGMVMPRYCLYGETVNTASNMKSSGQAGHIHLSLRAYQAMKAHDKFIFSERGEIPIKGHGLMKTYWLNGRRGEALENDVTDFYSHHQISTTVTDNVPLTNFPRTTYQGYGDRPEEIEDPKIQVHHVLTGSGHHKSITEECCVSTSSQQADVRNLPDLVVKTSPSKSCDLSETKTEESCRSSSSPERKVTSRTAAHAGTPLPHTTSTHTLALEQQLDTEHQDVVTLRPANTDDPPEKTQEITLTDS